MVDPVPLPTDSLERIGPARCSIGPNIAENRCPLRYCTSEFPEGDLGLVTLNLMAAPEGRTAADFQRRSKV